MTNKRTAFLFPGQGAQYPGMGKDLYEHYAAARAVFEEADDLLEKNLSKIIFEGPEAELTATHRSQLAIYVTSIAAWKVLEEAFPSLNPEVCAGLSLGEYTALTASKRLPFDEGIFLVKERGELMGRACEEITGSMAVIMGLDGEEVEKMVEDLNLPNDLWTANFNCPKQVVISGTIKGIQAGIEEAKKRGAKQTAPLKVHGAFHSGLMKSAEEKLKPTIAKTALRPSEIKLVMNVPGDFVEEAAAIKAHLADQVTHPVRWEKGIRAMEREGIEAFIEIGCGKTLSGMLKRMKLDAVNVENSRDLKKLEELTG